MAEPRPAKRPGGHEDVPAAPDALVIVGATATGKTDVAIAVARALNGEIISMDSRQIYRGLDIGTAKPSSVQRAAVPHHGIDLIDPDQRYNAGRFAQDARQWVDDIRGRGRVPILVGGTGFFLRALTHPMFREPDLPPARRAALQHWLDRKPTAELLHWLAMLDPELASRFSAAGGRQRMMRALEVVLLTGFPLGWWQRNAPNTEAAMRPLVFVLELAREELYRRINGRVIAMVEGGLVAEVRALVQRGYNEQTPGLNATGYREMLAYVSGDLELANAIDATQRATRRYARRQHTWFRHQLPSRAHALDARQPTEELAAGIVQRWQDEVISAHRN